MRKNLWTLALAAAVAATVSGCPKHVDVEGQAAEPVAERLALDVGTTLTGDRRNLVEAYTRATWVHAQLAAGDIEQAGDDLNFVEDQLKDVQVSTNVPAPVRERVSSALSRVNAVGRQLLAKDAAALSTARELVAELQRVTGDRAVMAWLRGETTGGGAGTTVDSDAQRDMQTQTPAERAGAQVALGWGAELTGDERNFAEAYTRATWVHAQLASGNWEQARRDLAVVLDQLKDVQASANVPADARARIRQVTPTARALESLVLRQDRGSIDIAAQLVTALNTLTSDTTIVTWLRQPMAAPQAPRS